MRWLRRVLVGLLTLVVLVTLLGAGWIVKVNIDHSRDEGAFIARLDEGLMSSRGPGPGMESVFAPVEDEFLIAEGDRACAWLRDQPYPWLSRDERFTFRAVVSRYMATNTVSEQEWNEGALEPYFRSNVVGGAWHYLCGEAWELREPHSPFNRPPDD
jgi:hypothetical protein